MSAAGWHEVAVVVRSECHDRTWIGHVQNATWNDTPAGPLRVVKAAVVEMIREDWRPVQPAYRWRHEGDTWVVEVCDE